MRRRFVPSYPWRTSRHARRGDLWVFEG
jgi:hypothetical protein